MRALEHYSWCMLGGDFGGCGEEGGVAVCAVRLPWRRLRFLRCESVPFPDRRGGRGRPSPWRRGTWRSRRRGRVFPPAHRGGPGRALRWQRVVVRECVCRTWRRRRSSYRRGCATRAYCRRERGRCSSHRSGAGHSPGKGSHPFLRLCKVFLPCAYSLVVGRYKGCSPVAADEGKWGLACVLTIAHVTTVPYGCKWAMVARGRGEEKPREVYECMF